MQPRGGSALERSAMHMTSGQRKAVALGLLAALAWLSRFTMEAGRSRGLVWVLLGGFALRILLHGSRERPGSG